MQTRKLIAGETLLLEEEKGFCLVVDGLVQIFVKSLRDASDSQDGAKDISGDEEDTYHEGNQGYQLLTEVKNGASMSSLFSILSLFTEDVKLRLDDEMESSGSSFGPHHQGTPESNAASNPTSPRHGFDGSNQLILANHDPARRNLPTVPPLHLDPPFEEQPRQSSRHKARRNSKFETKKSAHPDIVARAMVDSTIAIIPASAFRRLTRVYPRATAHIVQVILTRLQRVTLATAHQYLGLTTEVLQIEKLMNKYTSYDLPNHLRGSALDRLKEKFEQERDRIGPEEAVSGIALHNPVGNRNRRRSSSTLRKEAALAARLASKRVPQSLQRTDPITDQEKQNVSPGDLQSNIQISRFGNRPSSMSLRGTQLSRESVTVSRPRLQRVQTPMTEGEQPPFRPSFQNGLVHRQESMNEDMIFRNSVLDCLVKALGLSTDVDKRTLEERPLLQWNSRHDWSRMTLSGRQQSLTMLSALSIRMKVQSMVTLKATCQLRLQA